MSEQTAQLVGSIRNRLRTTIRRITLAEVAYGVVLLLGLSATCWLLFAGVEAQFWLGTTARAVLVGGLGAGAAFLLLIYVVRPLLRAAGRWGRLTETDVAKRIGARYPEVSDRLLNLLDLADGRRTASPSTLVDRAALRLGQDVQDVPFENVEDFEGARQAGRWAVVPVVLLLAFLSLAPTTFWNASQRLLAPGTSFERPAPFRLQVTPGAAQLVKGDSLRISAHTVGDASLNSITLAVRHTDEEHVERITLTPDSAGRVQHTLVNVRKPLQYRLTARPVTSQWFPVRLTERPLLERLRVRLDYPDYTRMPDRHLDANVGDVKALPGTEVHLETRVGGAAPDTAFLRFDDGQTHPLHLDGRDATGQFTLKRDGTYQVRLRNAEGVTNRAPITYQTQLLADEPPSVSMLEPTATAELDKSLQQGLRMRLADDFGFSALRLYWRRAQSKQDDSMEDFERIRLPLDNPRQLDQEVSHLWELATSTGLDLKPGDVIEYYVKVWDNDAVAGYQSAQTETHRLRYPSRADQYDQLDEQQSDAQETLEDAVRESEQVEEQVQKLRDEVRQKRGADWEDERQLNQLEKKQQEVESQVEEAAQQMQRMTDEMQRNNLSDEQTIELQKELQRVMDEVNAPEMQDAMDQLRKAMENMNMKQLQKSLQNTQKNQQQYRQRLKRALSLFKKAKMRQQLDEAARRAEALAKQEERLAEETKQRQQQKANSGEESDEAQAERDESAKSPDESEKNAEKKNNAEKPDQGESNQEGEENAPADSDSTNQTQSDKEHSGQKGEKGQQNRDGQQSPKSEQNGESREKQDGNMSSDQKPSSQEEKQTSANEDLARKQDEARQEMEKIQEKMEQLQKEMKSMQNAPQEQMEKLQKQMQKQQMSKQMQKNSQQLRQNQMQKAQQGQKQMQKQLQQMSQQMQQMQQQMQGQQRQMNVAGLRQALSDVLMLSQQQEGLRMGVRSLSSGDAQLRPYARRQRKLADGLRTVSDTLQHLANNIPQMRREVQEEAGSALDEMNTAVSQMTERHAGQAAGHQKASMMHLNELALMLSDLLTNMQQGGQGGGMSSQQMMQQLQQMAGQQQKLNQQIQQMLNESQGKRLSIDEQGRLQQMARQQEALQRQLEKLSRDRNVRGKALGDLQKIAEDMEETVKEMREQGASERTIERQRQIQTRLLNAQRSINNRGKKEERKGKTGEDIQRESPEELSPSEQAEKLRRDLIRALEKGYAPDYEQLIKRYFELLRESSSED